MQYRKFGRTNENVSVLGYGCMRLPILEGDPSRIDEAQATGLIRHAIDRGVNYIDTAYPYHGRIFGGKGECEPFLAGALGGGYRQKVKIATKMPSWQAKSREDMDRLLNDQLIRLGTNEIDMYMIHGITSATWPVMKQAGFDGFLNDAIRAGKIKHAGFSFHDKLEVFKEIVDAFDWSFCLIQYNFMDEFYQAGTEGMQYAHAKGLGIAVMEPLRGGMLANRLPPDIEQIIRQTGRTPAELGLRWIWKHPEVSVILSGMNAMDQLEENLKTAEGAGDWSAEEEEAVKKVRALFREKIKVGCTGCNYCMPCPEGVNIPGSFAMYNNYGMYGYKEPYTFRLESSQRASNCKDCGRCEEHCPQGIAIRTELKNVRAAFEDVN
jgi:uncharacterized protein